MKKSITRVVSCSLCTASLLAIAVSSGCTTPGKRTGIGAGAGAATGAAIGGAAGGWKGAGLGALAGAATGAAVGNYLDKQYKELEKVTDVKRVKDGLLVDLKNDLLFETNSAVLKPQAVDQLTELGQILSKYEQDRIKIAGFTDNVGTDRYNLDLSTRRAAAVRNILSAQGVRDDQMFIKGFGETRPVAPNATESGRSQNRRVELYIDVPQEKAAAVEMYEGNRVPASR